MNLTDKEIIKALECCSNSCDDGFAKCDECPRFEEGSGCTLRTMKNALDLINRQKAKIERLQKEKFDSLNCQFAEMYATTLKIATKKAKSEAIKEFAERVKASPSVMNCEYEWLHIDIDNLVKEMTDNTITKVEHNSLCETETYRKGES